MVEGTIKRKQWENDVERLIVEGRELTIGPKQLERKGKLSEVWRYFKVVLSDPLEAYNGSVICCVDDNKCDHQIFSFHSKSFLEIL